MITEFKLPELGENIASGTVVQISVSVGDKVKKDQVLLEIEASKATIDVPSPAEGTVKEIFVKEGQEANVGALVMKIDTQGSPEKKEAAPQKAAAPEPQEKQVPTPPKTTEESTQEVKLTDEDIAAAPSIRRLARERGIDLARVKGSGPAGRILEEDITWPVVTGAVEEELPDFSKWGAVETKPMSRMRLDISRHVAQAWRVIPQVTQFDKADMTQIEELIKKYSTKERKLTVTSFFVKIAASALKAFPQFNASLDLVNKQLITKKYFHIGVAVDTPQGLRVPVIRDADQKNIFTIADELKELAERARQNKLKIEEMQGGCFTVTNLGGIGGTSFAPIINWPQAAILGVSRSRIEPVYSANQFVPRSIITLSLSFDHRIIDGADGARFARWIAQAVEQPVLLELEG